MSSFALSVTNEKISEAKSMKSRTARRVAWIAFAAFVSLLWAISSKISREGFSKFFELSTQAPIEDDAIFASTDADLLLGSGYRNLPRGFESSEDSVPYEEMEDMRAIV
jgi:hypothetical protein